MADYKDTISASTCISDNMKTFADYTIETKLPHYLDGCKCVARRIMCVLHNMGPGLHKELSVNGEVVKMHPHGDASISTAISVMAQPFSHLAPLVFSDSSIGTYDGDEPAAARYVDVGESEIAKALFFTDINPEMFHMVPCESEMGTEPAYLIPRIPTALLISSFSIAVGYQSRIPVLGVAELCKMTKEYIKLRSSCLDWQTKARKQLVKFMLPDFPIQCLLRNSSQLLKHYRDGDFDAPIIIDGVMNVTKDQIVIHTLPPGRAFRKNTFDVGRTMAKFKNSWEAQNFQQMEGFAGDDQDVMQGNFICVVRRGMNPFDVLATLKKKLQFTGAWMPERHFTDSSGNLRYETPLTLMDAWYDVRYNAVLGDLKQTLNNLVDKQRRLLALVIVRDHAKEVFNIHNESKDTDDAIPKLVKRFNLTRYQARFVTTLTMAQMTARGKDELLQELEDIKKKMDELQKKFNKIPEIMIEHVESFEKQFVEKNFKQGGQEFDLHRRCVIPKYIGEAVYKGTGHILIEDETEFDKILKGFDPEDIEFRLFKQDGNLMAIGSDEDIEEDMDLPKYLKAGYIDRVNKAKYTACMFLKGGASIVSGFAPRQENMQYTVPLEAESSGHTECIVIEKNGHYHKEAVHDKFVRKNISSGPTMREVVWIGPGNMTDVVIIHGNSSQPNNLIIEREILKPGASPRLRKIPVGDWRILGVVDASTKRVYINIPKELRQRCTVRHVVIDNIGTLIKPGEKLNCTFGRTTIKSNFELVPLRRKSTIYQVKPV